MASSYSFEFECTDFLVSFDTFHRANHMTILELMLVEVLMTVSVSSDSSQHGPYELL